VNQGMNSSPRAFCVHFHELNRWDPISYYHIDWYWPNEIMAPIGKLLIPRKEKVDRAENGFADLMPITIHFDGSIEPRKVDPLNEYSMELFWARPKDIVVSKIDLKNGAVGIIPESWRNVVVTGHFAVYKPNEDFIVPEFFTKIIQTDFFKDYLWRNKVGAEGRKEVKLDFFESILIPVPPLTVQKMIEECWHQMNQEFSIKLEKIQHLGSQCHEQIQEYLDINIPPPRKIGKLFLLHLSKTERWSFEYNKRVLSGLAQIQTGKYRSYPLGELCKGQSGSTPSKNNPSFWKDGEIPWVSPKDMKTRYISDSQDHISQNAMEYNASPVVKNGSILFVVRSGILQRKVPVAMTQVDVSINQDIRSFTPRTDNILPEYLLAYFEAKQDDLLRLVKWSTTVQSINKEELETFPIPLPPKDIQEKIAMTVAELHSKMENLEKESNDIHQNAKHKIEEMILGTRPVECS